MQLTEKSVLDSIPVDCRDGLIEIVGHDYLKSVAGKDDDGRWYVLYGPGSDEEVSRAIPAMRAALGDDVEVDKVFNKYNGILVIAVQAGESK